MQSLEHEKQLDQADGCRSGISFAGCQPQQPSVDAVVLQGGTVADALAAAGVEVAGHRNRKSNQGDSLRCVFGGGVV